MTVFLDALYFKFQWLFQKEGQYVCTPVGVFHWGINVGPNVHEAWNLTSFKWSGFAKRQETSYCICGQIKDPARLKFDVFVDGVYRAKIISCTMKVLSWYTIYTIIQVNHMYIHIFRRTTYWRISAIAGIGCLEARSFR